MTITLLFRTIRQLASGEIRLRMNGARSNQSLTDREDFIQFTVNTAGGVISRQVHRSVEESSISFAYRFVQNYPNPFNPATTISFDLSVENHDTSTVYDMVGRDVATLVNDSVGTGPHSVTWDADNQSSGIYFYRLIGGSFTEIKKLTLIK